MGGGPVVIGGDNLPSLVRIGLTDLQNIGDPPGSPGSGTTAMALTKSKVRRSDIKQAKVNTTSDIKIFLYKTPLSGRTPSRLLPQNSLNTTHHACVFCENQ